MEDRVKKEILGEICMEYDSDKYNVEFNLLVYLGFFMHKLTEHLYFFYMIITF